MSQSPLASARGLETTANPFPGLRSFEFEESHLFFGRDGQSEQLITKLGSKRFLAVVGTSGSGKSSLVRAGLLPALLGGFMSGAGSNWRIAVMRPGNDPIGNLARALHIVAPPASSNGSSEVHAAGLEAALRRGSRGLVDVFRYLTETANENLLVVVDQFEEIFRLARVSADQAYQNQAAAFVKLFLAASHQREVPIYVVLTMRSDYLGDCAQFWGLPEAVNESQYLIPRLTRDQQREAINGPVAVGSGAITPRLVNRLLNDVGDNQDQLPILQHALMRSWNKWKEMGEQGPLDLREYAAIGGMTNALSLHADEAFGELPDEPSRKITEKLFKALTEKGPDNREIRRPITVAEACAVTGATESEIKRVVEIFRQPGRSFLMPPAEMPLHSESLLDISHESLIRCWQRLKDWVDEEGESARIYGRLAQTAELHQRGQAGLWGDPDLQLALEWREKNQPNEYWARRYHPDFAGAMQFLEQSQEQRDRDVLTRQKQQRKVRLLTLAFFSISLLALLVPAYLIRQSRKIQIAAEEEKKRAKVLLEDADRKIHDAEANAARITEDANKQISADRRDLVVEQGQVKKEQDVAEANQKQTLALRIAAQAADQFQQGDLVTSHALAIESLKETDSFQGRRALATVFQIIPPAPEIIQATPGQPVDAVAFSPDNRWMAWGTRGGQIVISDRSKKGSTTITQTDRPPVIAMSFSPNGRWLAAGESGRLWLLDTASGHLAQEPILKDSIAGNVISVAFSPDSQYLAVVNDGQIELFQNSTGHWNKQQRKALGTDAAPGAVAVAAVLFLSDDMLAVAGYELSFLRVPSLERVAEYPIGQYPEGAPCVSLQISDDSRFLLVGCSHSLVTAPLEEEGIDTASLQSIQIANFIPSQISLSKDDRYMATRSKQYDERLMPTGDATFTGIHLYRGFTTIEMFRTNLSSPMGPPWTPSFAFQPHSDVLAAGLQDGSIAIWHLSKGVGSTRWPDPYKASGLAFSPDKKWFVVANSDDGTVRILNASNIENPGSGSTFQIGAGLTRPIFSPDARFLLVADSKAIHLMQTNPWKRLTQHDISGKYWQAAFGPDSRMLVTANASGIQRFETANWQEKKPAIAGKFSPGFKFSPDGKWLATRTDTTPSGAHARSTLRQVWNLATGREAAWNETGGPLGMKHSRPTQGGLQKLIDDSEHWQPAPEWHDAGWITSPDGRWKIGPRADSSVEFLDAVSGKVGVLEHDDSVFEAAFSFDGRWLVTSSADKSVHIWPLQVEDLIKQACKLLPRNLTKEEWKAFSMGGEYHKTCPPIFPEHSKNLLSPERSVDNAL